MHPTEANVPRAASAQSAGACPHLPPVGDIGLSYRLFSAHGARRDHAFYLDALRYGHWLWLSGHAGRALLSLARALYAEVEVDEVVLTKNPLPYCALAWIIGAHTSDDFPGNPRISFQHQACRLEGPRRELRRARAWAVWAIACRARPSLVGDPSCPELELADISARLDKHGHRGESDLWREAFRNITTGLP